MAAAAIPLIEAAAIRILTALGVGVAAGAAGQLLHERRGIRIGFELG